jgi:hypothetical protein
MAESYRKLFRDFLRECSDTGRWWYLLDGDETDNSSLANLFGTTKKKLTELMVGANLAYWYGKEEPKFRLKTTNIESLCSEHKIDIELDLSKLTSYPAIKRRVIRIGTSEKGPKRARDQFSGEYLDPPRISRRCLRRVDLLDRLDRLLQPETETEEHVEEEEEEEEEQQQQQQQESLACAEELQQKQSFKEAYETQRADILTNNFLLSVFESSSFELVQ